MLASHYNVDVIAAPEILRFHTPKAQRLLFEQFATSIERSLQVGNRVLIDFRPTERLYPCGVLLFMGLVDSWIERFPGRLTARYPVNDIVEQMLQQVEVLEKLGLSPRKAITHDDVTRWHYFTGTNVDAAKIEPFIVKLRDVLGVAAVSGLYDCIAEAMTNVKHHAYRGGVGGRWWIFATVSESVVSIAIHDRGSSIPGTLLAKPGLKDYLTGRRLFQSPRGDSALIAAAVGGRTSTKLPYRGNGLPEMLEFTMQNKRSELGIYSRHGRFRCSGSAREFAEGRLDWPVKGTLILWTVGLSGEQT